MRFPGESEPLWPIMPLMIYVSAAQMTPRMFWSVDCHATWILRRNLTYELASTIRRTEVNVFVSTVFPACMRQPRKRTANSTGVCCSSCCSPRTLRSDMQGKPLDTQRLSLFVLFLRKLFQSKDRYVLHGSQRTAYCERLLQVSLF